MNLVLLTAGDPASNPRTRPLVTVLQSAGHQLTVVSPPVATPVEGVRHIQVPRRRRGLSGGRFAWHPESTSSALARAADSCDPQITYPLRSVDVSVADLMRKGFVLGRPGWPQSADRDLVWAGRQHHSVAGDWRLGDRSDRSIEGTTVHLVARFTSTTPARYLASAFERRGSRVVRHNGGIDWSTVESDSSLVLFVESPYPALRVTGERDRDVPVLFWVHHGEHHQPANLRLASRYSADIVLMAHSWHLGHQYPIPVFALPFGVPTELCPRDVAPLSERSIDVAMVGAGMRSGGGWYLRRQERVQSIEADESMRSVFTYGLDPREMFALYSDSRLVINDGGIQHFPITMRVFEAFATGAALATDPTPGLDELFTRDQHYRELATTEAAEIRDMLRDDSLATMALSAHQEALEHHTYDERVLRIHEIAMQSEPSESGTETLQPGSVAAVIDRDVEVQSILTAGSIDLAEALPDRDIRRSAMTDQFAERVFDAVALGADARDASVVSCARTYVYVVDGFPEIDTVRSRLAGWSETSIGSIIRFDSGLGGYRVRPKGHPLG